MAQNVVYLGVDFGEFVQARKVINNTFTQAELAIRRWTARSNVELENAGKAIDKYNEKLADIDTIARGIDTSNLAKVFKAFQLSADFVATLPPELKKVVAELEAIKRQDLSSSAIGPERLREIVQQMNALAEAQNRHIAGLEKEQNETGDTIRRFFELREAVQGTLTKYEDLNTFLKGPGWDRNRVQIRQVTKETQKFGEVLQRVSQYVVAAFGVYRIINLFERGLRDLTRTTLEYYDLQKSVSVLLEGFAGSIDEAAIASERLLRYAQDTKMPFRDALDAARELAPVMAQVGDSVEKLPEYLDVARKLAVLNMGPTGGVSGAIFSLAEAMSGDPRSIQRRFRIDPAYIEEVAEETGMTFVQALDQYLTENIGITSERVEETMETWRNTTERLGDSIGYLSNSVFGPFLEDSLIPFIDELIEASFAAGELAQTIESIELGAAGGGSKIAVAVEDLRQAVPIFSGIIDAINTITEKGPLLGPISFGLTTAIDGIVESFTIAGDYLPPVFLEIATALQKMRSIEGLSDSLELFNIAALQAEASLNGLLNAFMVGLSHITAHARDQFERLGVDVPQEFDDAHTVINKLATAFGKSAERAQEVADAARYAGKGVKELSDELEDLGGISDEAIEAWVDFQDALAEAQQDFLDNQERIIQDYNDRVNDLVEDYNQDRLRDLEDYERDRLRREEDFYAEYNALADGETGEVAKLLAKATEDKVKAEKEFRDDEADRLAEHLLKLKRMQEDHEDSIEEAAARLDAWAIVNERREYAKKVSREKEDFAREQAQREEEFRAKYDQQSEQFQRELELARQADAEKLRQMKEQFELEEKRRAEDFTIEQKRREEDHKAKLEQLDEQLAEELKANQDAYDDQREQVHERFATELNDIFIHGGNVLAIHRKYLGDVENELISWWNRNAELYLPPDYSGTDPWTEREQRAGSEGTSSELFGSGTMSTADYLRSLGATGTITTVPVFQEGGIMGHDGLAFLHEGEAILNERTQNALRSKMRGSVRVENMNVTIPMGDTGNRSDDYIVGLVRQGIVDAFEEWANG